MPPRPPLLVALVLCLLGAAAGKAAAVDRAVATPPLDYSVFRSGAVKRVSQRFGAWTLACDEIASLNRKFCSLQSLARTPDGTVMAALTVSTDDRGRPTALVTLPFGIVAGTGSLIVRPGGKGQPVQVDLRPALCDGQGCQVIWSLRPDDIRTLSAGAPLAMRFAMARGQLRLLLSDPRPPRIEVAGALPTAGFAEALRASLD